MSKSLAAIALLVLVAPLALAGGYQPDKYATAAYKAAQMAGQDGKNAKDGDPAAIEAGKAIFATKCATCHGPAGHGDGPAAIALDPRPADFSDASRWAFTSEGVKHWVILNGIKGTGMAPPGLSDDDAWNVLAYLQHDVLGH